MGMTDLFPGSFKHNNLWLQPRVESPHAWRPWRGAWDSYFQTLSLALFLVLILQFAVGGDVPTLSASLSPAPCDSLAALPTPPLLQGGGRILQMLLLLCWVP